MRLARRITEMEESATLAVTEKAAQLRAQGVDVVSLSAGEPDFDTPEHIKAAALDALKKGYTKYTAAAGILPLRKAVSRKLERDNHLTYDPSQILISCGCKHSIYNALQTLLEEGDEAIVPAPYWTSFPEMVKSTGARPIIVETFEADGFKLTPAKLEHVIRSKTRMLILNTPSNPTGMVYSGEELRSLAHVLERTNIFILSDEVYEKITYGDVEHQSIAALFPSLKERTVVVNSVSKTYAMTGWRIGYMAGPKEVIEGAAKLQGQSTSNPNSMAQYASLAALEGDQSCVEVMKAEYRRRRDTVVSRLRSIPGIFCREPQGAFYAFPRIGSFFGRSYRGRRIGDSVSFAEALLETAGVAVVPGAAFGADAYVRLSYATSLERLTEGLNRLERFVRELTQSS